MDQDNLWLYTPNTKRPARVSMQQRLTGEISNGDLSRTNFSGDYDAKLIGTETVGGVETYHLSLKARRPNVTYSKVEYWIKTENCLPVKATFFAVSGRVLKNGIYLEPKEILGHKIVTRVEFSDAVNKQRKSILVYSGYARASFPDSTFSKESLSGQ